MISSKLQTISDSQVLIEDPEILFRPSEIRDWVAQQLCKNREDQISGEKLNNIS